MAQQCDQRQCDQRRGLWALQEPFYLWGAGDRRRGPCRQPRLRMEPIGTVDARAWGASRGRRPSVLREEPGPLAFPLGECDLSSVHRTAPDSELG